MSRKGCFIYSPLEVVAEVWTLSQTKVHELTESLRSRDRIDRIDRNDALYNANDGRYPLHHHNFLLKGIFTGGKINPMSSTSSTTITTMIVPLPVITIPGRVYHLAVLTAHAAIGAAVGGLVHYTATAKSRHTRERLARRCSSLSALSYRNESRRKRTEHRGILHHPSFPLR